jgi:cyclophilin family peptidyl-prolyl cis-trans isomerase
LHLQKIEQQSIQLHENLNRMASNKNHELKQQNSNGNTANGGNSLVEQGGGEDGETVDAVDFELIHKQTQQLYQMEEELNHEVKTLQLRIQQSARSHIIQEFGEGPVQVILELDFGDAQNSIGGSTRISILLWHDTPHAAWTWLEQIGRNVWDGADFSWQQANMIDAVPTRQDPLGGKIEFVEQSQHGHDAWTVGLKENSETGSGLAMYVNLQDNTHYHKHETCVGKVIDGFDALQRLLEVSRTKSYDDQQHSSITIKSASAQHVTKREGAIV